MPNSLARAQFEGYDSGAAMVMVVRLQLVCLIVTGCLLIAGEIELLYIEIGCPDLGLIGELQRNKVATVAGVVDRRGCREKRRRCGEKKKGKRREEKKRKEKKRKNKRRRGGREGEREEEAGEEEIGGRRERWRR